MEDRIILALKPKIDELDRKVMAGESLGNEDINTLLLQHMFNHIHHLEEDDDAMMVRMDKQDGRMDRQDARMGRIEVDVSLIRTEMAVLDGKLTGQMVVLDGKLTNQMVALDGKLTSQMAAQDGARANQMLALDGKLTNQMFALDGHINLRMLEFRSDLQQETGLVRTEIAKLQTYVEKAINRNMLFYVGAITFLVAAMQLIDRLVPRS